MARLVRLESTGECDDLGAATAFAPSAVGAVTWPALPPSVTGHDRVINEALGAWLLKSPSLNTRASYSLDLNRFLDFAGCRRMRVVCGRAASRAGRWRRDREVRWSSVHDVPDIIRASGRSLSVGDGPEGMLALRGVGTLVTPRPASSRSPGKVGSLLLHPRESPGPSGPFSSRTSPPAERTFT